MVKAQVRGGGGYPQISPGYPLAFLAVFMYAPCLVPDVGGSLWEELMGFIDPSEDTPIDDEPQGYRVGAVDDDGTYQPRDRDEIREEHYDREMEEFRRIADAGREDQERQRSSRYTLRAMGFVFTDEGASLFETLGGEVQLDEPCPVETDFTAPYQYVQSGDSLVDAVMRYMQ